MKFTRTITIVIQCFLCATTQAQDSWIKNIEWEILKLGYSNTSDIADIKSGYFASLTRLTACIFDPDQSEPTTNLTIINWSK